MASLVSNEAAIPALATSPNLIVCPLPADDPESLFPEFPNTGGLYVNKQLLIESIR